MELNGKKIYLDGRLKTKLDNVKMMMKKNWDVIFLIDGIEGSGKSTLSFACGWYLSDGEITMKNICEGNDDAVKKLEKLPDRSILIIDEGSLMFSSKDTMRKEQRKLIKILQVIRQKMMCLIIVAPSFFDLNKYISIDRSRFLLHVYTDKQMNRGRFCFFSEKKKKMLYTIGKKKFNSYSKPKSDFVGSFTNFDPFGDEYKALKKASLAEAFSDQLKPKEIPRRIKLMIHREVVRGIIPKLPIKTRKDLAKALGYTPETMSHWSKPKETGVEG